MKESCLLRQMNVFSKKISLKFFSSSPISLVEDPIALFPYQRRQCCIFRVPCSLISFQLKEKFLKTLQRGRPCFAPVCRVPCFYDIIFSSMCVINSYFIVAYVDRNSSFFQR